MRLISCLSHKEKTRACSFGLPRCSVVTGRTKELGTINNNGKIHMASLPDLTQRRKDLDGKSLKISINHLPAFQSF
jgi:hypothetical protein